MAPRVRQEVADVEGKVESPTVREGERKRPGRTGTIRIRLVREGGLDPEVVPFGPPDRYEVDFGESGLEGVLAGLGVAGLSGEATLRPGAWSLPVTAETPLRVRVGEGARLLFSAQVEPGPAGPEVKELSLRFAPAVVLENVFEVLYRLPGVFRDRDVALVRQLLKAAARTDWARNLKKVGMEWLRWLDGSVDLLAPRMGAAADALLAVWDLLRGEVDEAGRLLAKKGVDLAGEFARLGDSLPEVWLEEARAEVRQTRAGRVLEFRFSGRLGRRGEEPLWSFQDVVLPHVVLPALRPRLADLLSSDPLATADFVASPDQAWAVFQVLDAVVSEAELQLRADTDIPGLQVVGDTPDLGEFQVQVEATGHCRVEGGLRVTSGSGVLDVESWRLSAEFAAGRLQAEGSARARSEAGQPLVALLEGLRRGKWREAVDLEGQVHVETHGALSGLRVGASYGHTHLRGRSHLNARVEDLCVNGSIGLAGRTLPEEFQVLDGARMELSGRVRLADSRLESGRVQVVPTGSLSLSGSIERSEKGGLDFSGRLEGDLGARVAASLGAFPELGVDTGELSGELSGRLAARLRVTSSLLTDRKLVWHGDGTSMTWQSTRTLLEMDGRELELPAGSEFRLAVREGSIATTGLGRAELDVGWDLQGRSPLLRGLGREVEIFVPELRRVSFTLLVSEEGGVAITGLEGGLYDAHFFNALVRPGAEPERWMEILADEEAMERVEASLSVLSEVLGRFLGKVRRWVRKVIQVLDEEGIREIRDIVPAERMARVLSRVLCGTSAEQERIHRIVRRVVDGEGLDVPAVRRLIEEYYPDHGFEFEVERGLKILARLLAPTEPVPAQTPLPEEPLVDRREHAALFEGLVSAGRLYDRLAGGREIDLDFWEAVARQAPLMTLQQLRYILDAAGAAIPSPHRERMAMVAELKERVHRISDSYGGIAFLPQAWAISFFLGQAIRTSGVALGRAARDLEGTTSGLGGGYVPSGVLGPWECAVLLHSCLASFWQGPPVQVNQALLLDYVAHQPAPFLKAVLWEMAHRSPRALAGVLYGLVQMEQQALREPVDVPEFLSRRLGIPVPRVEDYLAGGRRARESLFEALNETARRILEDAESYVAVRDYVQVARRQARGPVELQGPLVSLQEEAQQAIRRADDLGARVQDFSRLAPSERKTLVGAYEDAFAACRRLLAEEPRAFTLDWFREFYARNYEALMVLSVVRNVQEDVDRVRPWLETRLGRPAARGEQELLEQVVEALYFYEEDRRALLADPLVRLLLDPPPGRYEFTVVGCMGVITQGARGTELKDAFARLEAKRGIRVVRADTQTARSLEYNAAKVEEAVRSISGPWGYVGYSQGCANGLMAEARMLGGTPEQQSLVANLRCRNLLFSALNGSAHGTCGDWKFVRAMSDGDKFLKYYQAVLSRPAIDFALRNIRLLLDSKPFVHSLGGVASLSYEGVRALARDGQFRDDVPTTIVRGIVEPETVPEVLEMLSNWLTKEVETTEHDTQVTAQEAVGHPVWVLGAQSEVLRRCDMGGRVQRTHHWSPLYYAAEFVITDRDERLAVYDTPKDRHVFPWVEVNARFGIIPRAEDSGSG